MIAFNLASFLDEVGLEDKSEQEYLDSINLGTRSKVPGDLVFGALAAYDLGIRHKNKQLPDTEKVLSLAIDLGRSYQTSPMAILLHLGRPSTSAT